MPDTYGRRSGQNLLWIFLIGGLIAAIIAITLSAGPLQKAMTLAKARNESESFDQGLLNQKPYGPAFAALKTHYPADYDALKARALKAGHAGATKAQLEEIGAAFITKFMAAHIAEAATAPSANLKAFRIAQLDTLATLQQASEAQCADYFTTGKVRDDEVDPASRDALAHLGVVRIETMAAGRDHPTAHGKVTDADQLALFHVMQRNGLTPARTKILGDTAKLKTAPKAEQCAIAVIMARSINDLPAAAADRWTAQLAIPDDK